MDFWDIVSKFADSLGILSFVISIPTLIFAKSTRKAIQSHDDKKQYQQEIKKHINEMKINHESIANNDVYNEAILNTVLSEMDTLLIQYPTVVKSFKKDIKALQKLVSKALDNLKTSPDYNRSKVARKLNEVIQRLEKEEKS